MHPKCTVFSASPTGIETTVTFGGEVRKSSKQKWSNLWYSRWKIHLESSVTNAGLLATTYAFFHTCISTWGKSDIVAVTKYPNSCHQQLLFLSCYISSPSSIVFVFFGKYITVWWHSFLVLADDLRNLFSPLEWMVWHFDLWCSEENLQSWKDDNLFSKETLKKHLNNNK